VNGRVSALLVAALVLAGCTSEAVPEIDITAQTSTSTVADVTNSSGGMATSSSFVGDLGTTTVDLLDGSELRVFGPAELELGGYFYFLEIQGLEESNVYLTQRVDPTEAVVGEDAVFHSDLGDGVKLWVGERAGRPFFMTVEIGEWVSFVHVGWETAPDSEFLFALADQLRGEPSDRGVVIPDFDVDVFETSLHDPDSEDSVQIWMGQCLQEHIPGSEAIDHPNRGEMIRTPEYASWCESDNDLEVTVSGTASFVDRVVEILELTRTSLPDEEVGWLRIPHDEAVFGGSGDQVVTGVAASPKSLVAVGSEDSPTGSRAVSWISSDGLSWTRSEQVVNDSEMEDVVWFGAGGLFVAVGHQVSEAAVWTSPDGSSWTLAALIPFDNPAGGVEIESVTDTEQGLVAVGLEWYGEGQSIPAVWTSLEGQHWTRANTELTGVDEEVENGLLDVVGSEGDLFAVGYTWVDNVSYEPRLWASSDGAGWQTIDLNEDDAMDSILNAIAADDEGTLVIVGESDSEHVDSRAWVSKDRGRTWSRVEVETGAVGIPDLADARHTDFGWVAVGRDTTTRHEDGEAIAAVWHKASSGAWVRISPRDQEFLPQESPGSAGMTTVTGTDAIVVAGGVDGTDCEVHLEFRPCDLDAAFWVWIPSSA
jgi:hypothetical protein